MKKTLLFTLSLILGLSVAVMAAEKPFYSVMDYGAAADGKSFDTKAIQTTIDTAAKAGGGTVYFPAGVYLTGTIYLKNHITLFLDSGSVILGSKNLDDYPVNRAKVRSYTDNYVDRSLLSAEGLNDIAIVGTGTIDGQGSAYKQKEYKIRPYIIRFVNCEQVLVEGITLQNSPMWMQHYLACNNVRIHGITVNNFSTYNNDGLDIDACRDVRISDCQIFSDDDALCLKSTNLIPCENITITNCVLGSHCNAIKMGTESNGGFKNITISNCTIQSLKNKDKLYGNKRGLAGLALEIVDGGIMDRVTVSNLAMEGITTPIFIRLGNRARPFKKNSPKPDVGILRNVLIENVVATGASKVGCSITGQPDQYAQNITLRNIQLQFEGGGTAEDAGRTVPLKPAAYPESTMFGALPAYGFFCRFVDNLKMDNVEVSFKNGENRPAMIFDQVLDLTLHGFEAEPADEQIPIIVFNQVANSRILDSIAQPGTGLFLYSRESEETLVSGNDFRFAETVVKTVSK